MVRFLLDKSKIIAAYKHFASRTDFSTNKLGPEQARAEFLSAAEEWVGKQGEGLSVYYLVTINKCCPPENLVLHCAILSGKKDLVKLVLSARPEFLEVKSIDGWTPLLTAAMCQQVESIQALLEAGADPFTTDPFGRNMLHLFLVSPTQSHVYELGKLSSFFRIVDRPALHKLLEERCAESPGGLTPLARWISATVKFAPVALSIALLEFSTIKAMEMWDGRGSTPLHTVRFPLFYQGYSAG